MIANDNATLPHRLVGLERSVTNYEALATNYEALATKQRHEQQRQFMHAAFAALRPNGESVR